MHFLLDTDGEDAKMTKGTDNGVVIQDVFTKHSQKDKRQDIPLLEIGGECTDRERPTAEGSSASW